MYRKEIQKMYQKVLAVDFNFFFFNDSANEGIKMNKNLGEGS